uniref:Uncharacterized protein n=1 Tax=Sphaerodactylus townsendi TaxID=933632 RepID=A0ACB8ERQ2_9SAUR
MLQYQPGLADRQALDLTLLTLANPRAFTQVLTFQLNHRLQNSLDFGIFAAKQLLSLLRGSSVAAPIRRSGNPNYSAGSPKIVNTAVNTAVVGKSGHSMSPSLWINRDPPCPAEDSFKAQLS